MSENFYKKLVDLYAGGELTEELNDEMEAAALSDPDLARDMMTMKATVNALRNSDAPDFTTESFQRILWKMHQLGAEARPVSPEPSPWQYHLPMQG